LVESKNKLDQMVYQIENTIADNKDKIPEDVQKEVDELLKKSKELRDKEDATKEEIDT
jgi:molecular chaperone DnaK (HSP70)